jgi:hypothetical protein
MTGMDLKGSCRRLQQETLKSKLNFKQNLRKTVEIKHLALGKHLKKSEMESHTVLVS